MEQNFEELPAIRFVWSANFIAFRAESATFSSRIRRSLVGGVYVQSNDP